MLYRFAPDTARTADQLTKRLAAVTAGLPADAVTGAGTYLTHSRAGRQERQDAQRRSSTVFAGLSLVVAVLVIGNVVSGAVIAGFRSIGVLKAVGFSPGQVTAVFLLMNDRAGADRLRPRRGPGQPGELLAARPVRTGRLRPGS